MSGLPRTWIEISRVAVLHNLFLLRRISGPGVRLMPVIKANAYGHGINEILTILHGQKYWGLGVAHGEEALQIRAQNYQERVVVLSNWRASDLSELIKNNIEFVIWDFESLKLVQKAASRLNTRPKIHLKLDTGTTRIGFLPNEIAALSNKLKNSDFQIAGIFSHLASAEEARSDSVKKQLNCFTTLIMNMHPIKQNRGVLYHLASTAALLRYPEAKFGLVRPGIGLYGLWPSTAIHDWCRSNFNTCKLHPALEWRTRIIQIKTVPKGTSIGYGSSTITTRQTKVAILPVGYADGYDRHLSNVGYVSLQGQRVKILGRICMNMMMIDVTKITSAKLGQSVTLLGHNCSADDIAKLTHSINYEVTTRINSSLPRVIVK